MRKGVVVVENPSMSDSFALLGLHPHFNLDLSELEKNYLAAQAVVHPDLYIERSEVEKKIAVQTSATLNEAYQRLKHIQTRAQEFL